MTMLDDELVDALRAGDERAFAELVDRYSPAMVAVARHFVHSREAAEDVVQDTWLALLKGIDGFHGRSSLRTWLFTVLTNIARTRGVRDKRLQSIELPDLDGPTVSPERFRPAGDRWPGHWVRFPHNWPESPDGSLLSAEALELIRHELAKLPNAQRLVVSLRDLQGYDADEVCELLGLTPGNQRVLLHRGRAHIRQALAEYFEAAS
jgi:RNA polymerase sigma-70 factor (ECF subfamily)